MRSPFGALSEADSIVAAAEGRSAAGPVHAWLPLCRAGNADTLVTNEGIALEGELAAIAAHSRAVACLAQAAAWRTLAGPVANVRRAAVPETGNLPQVVAHSSQGTATDRGAKGSRSVADETAAARGVAGAADLLRLEARRGPANLGHASALQVMAATTDLARLVQRLAQNEGEADVLDADFVVAARAALKRATAVVRCFSAVLDLVGTGGRGAAADVGHAAATACLRRRALAAVQRASTVVRDRLAVLALSGAVGRRAATAGRRAANLGTVGAAGGPAGLAARATDPLPVDDVHAVAAAAVGVGVAGGAVSAAGPLAGPGRAMPRAAVLIGGAAGGAVGLLAAAAAAGLADTGADRDAGVARRIAGQAPARLATATLQRGTALVGDRPALTRLARDRRATADIRTSIRPTAAGLGCQARAAVERTAAAVGNRPAVFAVGRAGGRRATGTGRVLNLTGAAADAAATRGGLGVGRRHTAARAALNALFALLAVALAIVGQDNAPPDQGEQAATGASGQRFDNSAPSPRCGQRAGK
jgi:hypothetical protein